MPRRLKVFQAQFGFWDCVVAATSQAAALRAWGTRQNLFAEGDAREIHDESAVAAALAQPDTPLRRAVGSDDAFSLEPRLPQLPPSPAGRKASGSAKPRAAPPAPPPDRGPLEVAEAALRRLADERDIEVTAFARRRADLENEEAAARKRYDAARSYAEKAVARCRKDFAKAGGNLGA